MALKNLLVHLDDTRDNAKRVEAAFALAAADDAHLSGLYVAPTTTMPSYIATQVPREAAREHRKALEAHAREIVDDFGKEAERAGVSSEGRLAHAPESDIAETVALHARYADLAVLGQANDEDIPAGGRHLVEEVTLAAGRPVLVVPYIGAPKVRGRVAFGRRVMIAWDAGREATRAVNDALPFLERAEAVEVVCVNPAKAASAHGEDPGADIALHLARHGVKVEVEHMEVRDLEVGDALLSHLADRGSDLLVMGCYGHSRLRELVLGGATRALLAHMTVPVLMSH